LLEYVSRTVSLVMKIDTLRSSMKEFKHTPKDLI
jgi:hypothetical protein